MNNIIEIRELCFGYHQEAMTLKNLNMDIPRGKITTILGCNGAGKSTLFLNLNGVLRPTSGEIIIDGKKLEYSKNALLEMRKNVGIVFQDPDDQLFSADVYRDICFGPMNLGLPMDEVKKRAEHAMERTGVSHLRERPTHALSYGQKKRVAIAGVLAMEPQVIILDEPTAGLDPKGVNEIMDLLDDLRSDKGISIILATHDIDIVPSYADYVYVMRDGQVTGQGGPKEIFSDHELIRANDLRLPILAELIGMLAKDGIAIDSGALTMEEVYSELSRSIKRS
ncbi:MAG: ATP-binding cassette domain-containing protein [Peptostreptococcaceae bacterium]|nr:ATP-binding cassette domain-containing protein [Peptostreptococcaceae bacterium]